MSRVFGSILNERRILAEVAANMNTPVMATTTHKGDLYHC
jgi:hypothetical protein